MPLNENDFQACMKHTQREEGGFVNNASDTGGATKFGITIGLLQAWHANTRITADDVRKLTLDEATVIYRAWFWTAPKLPLLRRGLDLIVFDFGVNASPYKSTRLLQGAVDVKQDGILGPISQDAIWAANLDDLIDRLCLSHEAYYRSLSNFSEFGHGWLSRNEETCVAAHERAKLPTERDQT